MKKLFALLLSLSMLLCLAACGEQVTNLDDSTEPTANTTEEPTGATEETQSSTPETTEATVPAETEPAVTTEATEPEETTPATTQPVHTHSYSSKVTKAATCTEKGSKLLTCSCGKSYTADIPATGHSYSAETTTEPTCTAEGVKTYTCTCGDSYTEPIEVADHTWGEWTVYEDATSIDQGESRRTCQNCPEYESKEIPLKPAKEATADNTINITGTDYEAIVRQYTNDHHHDSYDDEYEGYDFSINGVSSNMNVLGLTSFYAAIRVIPFTAEKGELYTSSFQGLSPYASLDGMEVLQKTIADGCVAFKCQPKCFGVDGTNDWVQYNSFDEIPESVMQEIINGQARLTVIYNTPGDTEFQLSISHSGSYWTVQLFARYRLPRGI